MWCPAASSCLARRSTGPLMSYRTFCSLLAWDTMSSAPPSFKWPIVPEEGAVALGINAGACSLPAPVVTFARNAHRRVGMPGKQILQADFHQLHGPAKALLAVFGFGEFPWPRPVTPACPG